VPTEVIVEASVLSVQTLNTIAASLNMTPMEDTTVGLTGASSTAGASTAAARSRI